MIKFLKKLLGFESTEVAAPAVAPTPVVETKPEVTSATVVKLRQPGAPKAPAKKPATKKPAAKKTAAKKPAKKAE